MPNPTSSTPPRSHAVCYVATCATLYAVAEQVTTAELEVGLIYPPRSEMPQTERTGKYKCSRRGRVPRNGECSHQRLLSAFSEQTESKKGRTDVCGDFSRLRECITRLRQGAL
jgi:hypothetical protein